MSVNQGVESVVLWKTGGEEAVQTVAGFYTIYFTFSIFFRCFSQYQSWVLKIRIACISHLPKIYVQFWGLFCELDDTVLHC